MKILSKTELEQLLQQKSFRELTHEERRYVLKNMEQEEYERLHALLARSKAVLKNTPPPSPAIRQNLLAALRRQQAPQPRPRHASLVAMLHHRIPAWQAAAVAVCVGILFWFQEKPLDGIKPERVYIYVTDTVYKEASLPTGMDTALNVPQDRVNVKPALSGGWENAGSIADSSSSRPDGKPGLPDSLQGLHPEPEEPGDGKMNGAKSF